MLIAGAAVLFGITTADGLIAFYENGHGPLAALPLAAQMIIFLIGEDFILYWTHRLFHGKGLWKYHAVHHSSEELEWISAARFHPVNLFFGAVIADVVLLITGISPNVFVVLGPITIAHSAFVHANLDWTLGPFKYVIAARSFTAGITPPRNAAARRISPRLSRFWICSSARSTCRPASCPDSYGIDDREFPTTFGAQLVHPFTK